MNKLNCVVMTLLRWSCFISLALDILIYHQLQQNTIATMVVYLFLQTEVSCSQPVATKTRSDS